MLRVSQNKDLVLSMHDMMILEMVDASGMLYDLSHTSRKGFGTPLHPVWAILEVLHLIFHAESVHKHKNKELAGKLCQLWSQNAIAIGMLYDLSHTSRKDLEHLCILCLCGQYVPCSISFSMLIVT